MSGKSRAALMTSRGWLKSATGPSGSPLCRHTRLIPSLRARSSIGYAIFSSSTNHPRSKPLGAAPV